MSKHPPGLVQEIWCKSDWKMVMNIKLCQLSNSSCEISVGTLYSSRYTCRTLKARYNGYGEDNKKCFIVDFA